MRTREVIISEINTLLDELSGFSSTSTPSSNAGSTSGKNKGTKNDKYAGCMGGITYLKDQGFFSMPRGCKEVIIELSNEGWHYSSALVSMNLLNLTRSRVLTRIQDGKKGWLYVVRK